MTPLVTIAAGKQQLSVRLCNNIVYTLFTYLLVVCVVGVLHVSAALVICKNALSFMEPHVIFSQIPFF